VVLRDSTQVLVSDSGEPGQVKVVVYVTNLNPYCEWVSRDPVDKVVVRLSLPARQSVNRADDVRVKSKLAQTVKCDRTVLHEIAGEIFDPISNCVCAIAPSSCSKNSARLVTIRDKSIH